MIRSAFPVFLIVWTALNLVQGAFTPLDPDEAYYWMYSRQLDWGYFDHPPVLAVMIHLGYFLIPNELGIRLMAVLFQSLFFYVIWLLAGRPSGGSRLLVLASLMAAMPMLQIYGFIATPDSPLLLFTALFFYLYKRFLQSDSLVNALLLGACMALLLYSKYHGVLIIFFVLLSNLSLLRRPNFYLASSFGALLFLPHLYWQYANDFPSFRYHLQGRDDPYQLKHTLNYLLNQLLVFNPFLFPMIIAVLWRQPIIDKLERAFYFVIFGFWIFFFWMTFKGHAEPQWTAVLTIPFILLVYRYSEGLPVFDRWMKRFSLLSIFIFLALRIALILDLPETSRLIRRENWIFELKKEVGDLPVVFENSYRNPSLYNFYLGGPAYTFTDIYYRKSQYDIWDWEKELHNGKAVVVIQPGWKCEDCLEYEFQGRKTKLKFADSLQIVQKLEFNFSYPDLTWKAGSQQEIIAQVVNPYPHSVRLDAGNMPVRIAALFATDWEFVTFFPIEIEIPGQEILPGKTDDVLLKISVPEGLDGSYRLFICTQTGELPPAYASYPIRVRIED